MAEDASTRLDVYLGAARALRDADAERLYELVALPGSMLDKEPPVPGPEAAALSRIVRSAPAPAPAPVAAVQAAGFGRGGADSFEPEAVAPRGPASWLLLSESSAVNASLVVNVRAALPARPLPFGCCASLAANLSARTRCTRAPCVAAAEASPRSATKRHPACVRRGRAPATSERRGLGNAAGCVAICQAGLLHTQL